MKIGITLNDWKVKIFKKRLKAAGFEFKLGKGFSDNTRSLVVDTDEIEKLKTVIAESNAAAAKSRVKK